MSWENFPLGPDMLERAFGPIWGPRLFRLLAVVAIVILLGSAVFGGLHGFATLRADYTSSDKPAPTPPGLLLETAQKPDNPPSAMGSNNTIVNAPVPSNMGNGNTIVGPTDSRGNTIINQGGTAIGNGACADGTSIAIGAGANAGACTNRK